MKERTTWSRRLRSLALFGAAAVGLSAWAGFDMTNPVTGDINTYDYKYVGSGAWDVTDWQDSSDPATNPSAVPQASGSDLWSPLLIDGNFAVTAPAHVEGWAFRIGLFGGATLTVPYIRYWNGTAFAVVDEGSKLTIQSINTSNNWTAPVDYYVAAAGGITYTCAFSPTVTSAASYNYYLKGAGSVVYEQAVTAGSHVIKQADVKLTGTSQVASKTLVTFGSGTTATFSADATVKVYGTDGTTLATTQYPITVNTTGTTTLTTNSAVGTVELVQTSTGIDLYYVDGDPSTITPKTYLPSISVNFTSGTALSTLADVGVGDYAVPGTSWNNLIGNNGTLSTVTQVDSTGAASTVAGVGVTISGTRGYWTCDSVTAATDLRQGYIDDSGTYTSPQVVVSGIPYYSYYAVVYFSNHDANVPFGYVTINGTNYKWDSENSELVECEGTSSDSWGASSPTAWTEGGNYIVTPTIDNTDGTFTIVSHRLSTSVRSGIAAIQIVEVPKTAEEGELVINVFGDTTYPVSEDAAYTTVYVTGAGTLAFSGEGTITMTTLNVGVGATVPMGSYITPTTVTGAGTVVYDGAQPSTTLGFDESANWLGTVWVKNVGGFTNNKVDTCLGTDTATASDNALNNWGNVNSFVKFTNVKGYVGAATCPWTLVLEDDGDNYAWYDNDGWTARASTFGGLKGSGTFHDVENTGCRAQMSFADVSGFTGTITVKGKVVCLGGTVTGSTSSGFGGTIEIASGASVTLPSGKTWTTGDGGFLVNGTLNANGTLASSSSANAVRGSGTVVFTGSAPTPTGDTWWKNANWTGTVELNAATAIAGWEFNNYGHSGSTLRLNNCRGWLKNDYTCIPALEIGGTFTWNDGSSGLGNTFKVGTLKGSGTISIPTGGAATAVWQITDDWSGFTGAVVGNNTDGRRVLVFGPTLPATVEAGEIYVSEGATLNLGNASATWWTLGKGFVVDGTVVSPNRDKWGGGTAMTLGDTGILELTSTANTEDYKDYSGVTGTGTIKYSSTAGWRTFPVDDAKAPPTTLTIQVELVDSLIITRDADRETVIGNLAGSKNIRSDWNPSGSGSANDARTLTVTQSKDTEWSGKFVSNRITQFNVNPGASTTGTLTLSGTQTETVPAAINGSVNLTGTWVGATTVAGTIGGTGTLTGDLTFAEGATFKVFANDGAAATDTDGLAVSGTLSYPETGTVTVELDAVPTADAVLLSASGLDAAKFELAAGSTGSLKVENDTLVYVSPYVTVTVPAVAGATVAVTVGGETVSPTTEGGTAYAVPEGAAVTVTYTAAEGYALEGTSVYTIASAAEGDSVTLDGTTVAKQYVASITVSGTTTKYTSLQAAVDAAARSNRIVLLADESVGATVGAQIMFYVYAGEFEYGEIVAGENYILTVTPDVAVDEVVMTQYSCAPADIIVTVGGVTSLYTLANAQMAIDAATAGGLGSTLKFVAGGASYESTMAGYGFTYDSESDIYTLTKLPVAAVYKGITSQGNYFTLADAVAAVAASEDSGLTVKLLADVTLTGANDAVVFPATFEGTLDLNGHSIQRLANSYYVLDIVNGANVTIQDSSTGGAGMVKGTPVASGNTTYPASLIRVKGKLTLVSGSLVSDYCCVKVDEDPGVGEFVMNGGTVEIIANDQGYTGLTFTIMNWGVATVNGGTHRGNVQSLSSSGNNDSKASTLTINGGSFDPANIYMIAYDTDYAPTVKIAKTITNLTVVNNSAPALGYEVSGPVEEGNYNVYTLAVPASSGIDPTTDGSSQTVTPSTADIETYGSAEAAAIELATVTVPTGVSVDAATYKGYFKFTATEGANGAYDVEIAGFADEVVQDADTSALAGLTGDGTTVSVTVPAGLYYKVETFAELGGTATATQSGLSTGTATAVEKPSSTDQGFVKVTIATAEIQ